jgi:hypothetical protein
VLFALVTILTAHGALAASEDSAVAATVEDVLNDDYAQGNFGEAKKKLSAALDRCKPGKCSGATRAQVFVALGMVQSQLGRKDDAKENFASALAEDPKARLPSRATPDQRTQFKEVQEASGTDTSAAAAAPAPGAKIPGWNSAEAFQLASAGLAADMAGKLDECIEKDKASLQIEEQPRTRLHLSSCEARSGKLIDALRNAQKALEAGIKKRDAGVMKVARDRVQSLLARIPHVTFVPPQGVDDLTVTFDEREVPKGSLTKKFSVDPGKHHVRAEGLLNGIPVTFDKEYDIKEGDYVTVAITMSSPSPEYLTPGQLRCMLQAKTQDAVLKCLPENKKNLVVKASLEVAGYADTLAVQVFTPKVTGSVTSPTSGWNVGGSYTLDVLSAASPDIVSMASRKYGERRHAGGVSAGYKPGLYGVQANANVSSEPDYLSLSAGGAVTADLRDKLITPRLGYTYMSDTIGKGGTPFSVFSRDFRTHEFDVGATFVLSATSVLMVGGTLQFERGDQSKPYRHVPMFDPQTVAPFVPVGATVELVNRTRLPMRPIEQLPTERDRFAIAARFAHRFSSSTLRIEQRFYYDTWQTKASTTDGRYLMDITKRLRVWPHLRMHVQSGTNFYQLAYSAVVQPDGTVTVPLFRTGDRELAPMGTATVGGGTRIALTKGEAKTQFGLTIQGDLMYSRFLNSLFVTSRTAIYGAIGLDAEFE